MSITEPEKPIGSFRWPEERIDSIGNCKKVERAFINAPMGKHFTVIALSKITDLDPKTAEKCAKKLEGKDVGGGIICKTTPNGSDLYFRDPKACGTLASAELKASREGDPEMTKDIEALRFLHCRPKSTWQDSNYGLNLPFEPWHLSGPRVGLG
jgi:hypothetical protein